VLATSAALLQKVAARSLTRWDGAATAHQRAEALRIRAEELVVLDSLAYLAFVKASRTGQEVEAARRKTIDVPIEIAGAAAEVLASKRTATRTCGRMPRRRPSLRRRPGRPRPC
jgi:hypothetical protein